MKPQRTFSALLLLASVGALGCDDDPARPAVFHTLTVNVNGPGVVRSSVSGIDCPTDCAETYAEGNVVTLRPIGFDDAVFAGWTGVCADESGSCTLSLRQDETVDATFE